MRLVSISVLCVAVLAGCSHGVGASSAPPPAASPPASAGSAATDAAAVRGAVDAALTFVASTDDLMAHSPVGRREIVRKLMTSDAADPQLDALEDAADKLADTMGVPVERLVWVEAPIATNVVDATADTADVNVWTVSILGAPDAGSPQQVWRTVHVRLVGDSGRWLVDGADADAGPTPAASELSLQSTFAEFEQVAGWAPVVTGVGL